MKVNDDFLKSKDRAREERGAVFSGGLRLSIGYSYTVPEPAIGRSPPG
jgi:hypothetical protein